MTNGETPLVSVVMIFLNAGRFIGEAIESVRAQTYGSWELILVDDGSSDSSSAVARAHAEHSGGRIRYVTHPARENRGMSASRNLGIAHAHGRYLTFLDADDVWRDDALKRQVALLDAHPTAGMVYGTTEMWHDWSDRAVRRDHVRRLGVPAGTLFEPPDLLTLFLHGRAKTPATCSLIVRREVVDTVGGFESSFRGMYEDQAFVAKVCLATPVFATDACWSRYRQHPESCCAVAARAGDYHPDRPNRARLTYLAWLEGLFARQKVRNRPLRRALGAALWPYRHPRLAHAASAIQPWLAGLRTTVNVLRNRPPVAYESRLVPPMSMLRREGIDVLEEWFRWGDEWSMLLRIFAGLSAESAVLEIGCGLGRIAFPLRHVLSADGSYAGLDDSRDRISYLKRTFGRAYPNFRFAQLAVPGTAHPSMAVEPEPLTFPYPSDSFDIVFAAGTTTQMPPEVIEQYLRETGRVLKPGGRAVYSLFLVDQYRPGLPRPSVFAGPSLDFDHADGNRTVGVRVASPDPHGPRAYQLSFVERVAEAAGMTLPIDPLPGLWSGSAPNWIVAHDVVVLEKSSAPTALHGRGAGHSREVAWSG